MLINLLANAVKFTPKGGEILEASYEKKVDKKGLLLIQVIDTGIGTANNLQSKIFQPFTQLHDSSFNQSIAQTLCGNGLGLSITQSLSHTNGSELKVESFISKSSVFTLHLPVDVTDEPIGIQTNLTFHEPQDNAPIRLLVIDDDAVNRLVVCTTLQRVFINAWIDQGANGTEGFEKMSIYPYNLVLIDLVMPDIDEQK